MSDMSFLVEETYRLRALSELEAEDGEEVWEPEAQMPAKPGILFHVENHGATFIVRTFAAQSLAYDYAKIMLTPEEYPSLRLITEGQPNKKLEWVALNTELEAQTIHARLGHKRFPLYQTESLTEPGFNWRCEKAPGSFTIYTKSCAHPAQTTSIGPMMDTAVAMKAWEELAQVMSELPLGVEVKVDNSRFSMSSTENEWIVEEFAAIFTEGVVGEDLRSLFVLLGKKVAPVTLEASWNFLHELAAVRLFWVSIQNKLQRPKIESVSESGL